MRLLRSILAALLIAASPAAKSDAMVGAYIWGDYITTGTSSVYEQFYQTVRFALAQGYPLIRVIMSPSTFNAFAPTDCTGVNNNMACLASITFNSSAWDDQGLKVVEFTALASSCAKVQAYNCFYPTFLTANATAIEAEFTALMQVTYDRFQSRLANLTFYISNWEGDNFINCGSAYSYELNVGGYDATCNASFPASIQTLTARAQGFYQYITLIDNAVAAFKASHSSMNVVHAPQGVVYNMYNAGTPCNTAGYCNPATDSVFKQLAINGRGGVCDYSSYNTQGPPDGLYLSSVQDIIANSCPGGLIIGEAGYDANTTPASTITMLYAGLDQLKTTTGVIAIVPWWLNDNESSTLKVGTYYNGALQLGRLMRFAPTPQAPVFYK